jgi:hypothetical protein
VKVGQARPVRPALEPPQGQVLGPVQVQLPVRRRRPPAGGQKPALMRHLRPPRGAQWERTPSRRQGPVPLISGRAGRGHWKERSVRTCPSPLPQFPTSGRDPAAWEWGMRAPGGCPLLTWRRKGHGDGRVCPGKSKVGPLGAGGISCRIRTSGLSGLPRRTLKACSYRARLHPKTRKASSVGFPPPPREIKVSWTAGRGLARRSHAYQKKVCGPSM